MNERQKKLMNVRKLLAYNNNSLTFSYHGVMGKFIPNIDMELDLLDNLYDQITLAQWANNFKKVKELMTKFHFTSEMNRKIKRLLKNNEELFQTLNFEILESRYDFLAEILDMIVSDINIQQFIVGLSPDRLKLFAMLYKHLLTRTEYPIPYLTNILKRISYTPLFENMNENGVVLDSYYHRYSSLNTNLEELCVGEYEFTEEELDTLLFIYCSDIYFKVNHIGDTQDFDPVASSCNSNLDLLDSVKEELLLRSYGLSLQNAKKIIKVYDIEGIEVTEENKDTLKMYQVIYQIVKENDYEKLKTVLNGYIEKGYTRIDFRRTIVFETDLRKIFARAINDCIFNPVGKKAEMINGVPVIDAGVDFMMLVSSVGAFQPLLQNIPNYFAYWNSKMINSHCNCCSIIANNNLTMAPVHNTIFGFCAMNENMLLLSSDKDINSYPMSRRMDITSIKNQRYMHPVKMINATRGDLNELGYERRDFSKGKTHFKKNPDYVVIIEEYEDFAEKLATYKDAKEDYEMIELQKIEQEERWEEAIKASRDLGIPVVRINRERCAKSELGRILNMVKEFKQTLNPVLLSEIICRYEGNRVSTYEFSDIIRHEYFSKIRMQLIITELYDVIIRTEDLSWRLNLLKTLKDAFQKEKDKYLRGAGVHGQESALDYDYELKRVDDIFIKSFFGNNLSGEGRK